MSSNDSDTAIDFRLVQTYTPAMLLFLRAILLLCLYATLTSSLSFPPAFRVDIAILVMSCWVYLDGWVFRNDSLSRTAGFLAPPFLLICTMSQQFHPQTRACSDIPSLVVYYAVGIVWATSCNFCVINMLLQMQTRFNVHAAAILWGVACIVLTYVDCRKRGCFEIFARTMLYYSVAIVMFFSQTLQPDRERNRFAFGILHTSIHLLFVDPYVVAGSVFILFCVFVYHFNEYRKQTQTTTNIQRQSMPEAKMKTDVSDSLLRELQAAKRAQGNMA